MRLLICLIAFFATSGFYDITLHAPDGAKIPMSGFKGKKVLIVNIASASRWAGQLGHLEELQRRCDPSLVIIGIPSNSFTHEPLDNKGINDWIFQQHVNFLITEKTVVSGASQSALYHWLEYPVLGDYQKYLVDEKGKLIGFFSSDTDPLSPAIINTIKGE
jgi:glutathione peroxidase